MSVEPATIDAEGYCLPEDVAIYFDRFEEFTAETYPPEDAVRRRIAARSSEIDSYTNHAWRERRQIEEYKNLDGPYRWNSGLAIKLAHRDIRTPLDASKGDKVEFWRGSRYQDFVSDPDFQEGRDEDFWIEESTGFIYIRRRRTFFNRYRELRITYRYGKDKIPAVINDACAKLVAADLMVTDFYRYTTPGNEEAPNAESVADRFREQAYQSLEPYIEIRGQGMDMS